MVAIRRRIRGFTLIELLVTIVIVIILAGVVIASMPGIVKSLKRKETSALIVRIEQGLNVFHNENGYFPVHPDPAEPGSGLYPDSVARDGAVVLYRNLSGDYDMDGKVDPGADPFVDQLLFEPVGSGLAVVDPFGTPLRYLAGPPSAKAGHQRRTRNPGYDLWSLGGSSDPDNVAMWLTSW